MWGWGVQIQTVPTVPGLIYMLELNPLLSGILHYDWDSFNTCSVNTFQVFILLYLSNLKTVLYIPIVVI